MRGTVLCGLAPDLAAPVPVPDGSIALLLPSPFPCKGHRQGNGQGHRQGQGQPSCSRSPDCMYRWAKKQPVDGDVESWRWGEMSSPVMGSHCGFTPSCGSCRLPPPGGFLHARKWWLNKYPGAVQAARCTHLAHCAHLTPRLPGAGGSQFVGCTPPPCRGWGDGVPVSPALPGDGVQDWAAVPRPPCRSVPGVGKPSPMKGLGCTLGPCLSCSLAVPSQLAQKYDPQKEAELRTWIESVTGQQIGPDFQKGLKDGVILCE